MISLNIMSVYGWVTTSDSWNYRLLWGLWVVIVIVIILLRKEAWCLILHFHWLRLYRIPTTILVWYYLSCRDQFVGWSWIKALSCKELLQISYLSPHLFTCRASSTTIFTTNPAFTGMVGIVTLWDNFGHFNRWLICWHCNPHRTNIPIVVNSSWWHYGLQ